MANEQNLIPAKKGEVRNPKGKPKGTKHLSTIIQELQDEVDWDLTTLKSKDELSKKYGKNGMKALVYVAYSKAMSGDVKAMEWMAKHGYGERLKLEIDDPRKAILDKYGLGVDSAGKTEEAERTAPADSA